MKVSGASLQSLHSGATGWPIRFWCLDKKLCPVNALVSSCTYDRENSSSECVVLVLTAGKKNLVCIYCGSSCHLVFHSSSTSLFTNAFVSHQGLGMYLVMFCPFAPSFAAWSASSLPGIPTWALIQASFTV